VLAGRTEDAKAREAGIALLETLSTEARASGNGYVVLSVASLYDNLGLAEPAEAMYREVLRLLPDEPVAQNNLAMLLVPQNRLDEALKLATAATTKDHPNRADFLETLGQVHLARN